ncbi:uncharacterized protein LOC106531979 [Austrofundulus limnaeus]|uniref:Uncharacterized protein LOC106531979 n=1 Tax=Austrofundulus limnaeus TaxID=52670 RepID=A0A2I4CTT1_AUSLI|nr:PREDICTED: uncharacterized protein LOC106531979 [Austrofundulus limnaeus]
MKPTHKLLFILCPMLVLVFIYYSSEKLQMYVWGQKPQRDSDRAAAETTLVQTKGAEGKRNGEMENDITVGRIVSSVYDKQGFLLQLETKLSTELTYKYGNLSKGACKPGYAAAKMTTIYPKQALILATEEVRRALMRVPARKAASPDGIPGRILKSCANQLAAPFTDIYNASLAQSTVPACFKATTVIPIPKKTTISCLNDYRPIALTPIAMKCFERLILGHIKNSLPGTLDPHQFAYRQTQEQLLSPCC